MLRGAALLILATALPAAEVRIRVLDLFQTDELLLRASSVAIGEERLSSVSQIDVIAEGDMVVCQVGSRAFRGSRLTAAGPRLHLAIPDELQRTYPGKLEITASEGVLRAIVQMDREDAVAAVVAAEMPNTPQSALEAQAVAARSYYAATMPRHNGFDFCDTTHCQVLQQSTPTSRRAAQVTNGQILYFENKPVGSMYFRSCSGRTLTAADVKLPGGGYPFFGVDCEECLRRPFVWETPVPEALAGKLLEEGPSETLRLELARIIGWNRLPSNSYSATHANGMVVFHGKGHGHGVGLCQQGAIGMAKRGASAAEILRHYYPRTVIRP